MLKIKNVSKIYMPSKKEALRNVSLEIGTGEFTALLGQNGAGKTTLINILAGNVKKSGGSVMIGGHDLDADELATKQVLGIVPQEMGYDFLFTVEEALRKQSGYFGIRDNREYIDELLEALFLTEKKNTRIGELSGGMRRRFMIAKALVHKPELLILDEPTAGVDIEMRHTLYDFLRKLHQSGMTIILTTHYLEEAEKLCDRIIIIDHGKIIADEQKDRLIEGFSDEVTAELHFDRIQKIADFEFLKEYEPQIVQDTKLQIRIRKKELPNVLRKISQENLEFDNFIIEKQKLEDIYLDIISR